MDFKIYFIKREIANGNNIQMDSNRNALKDFCLDSYSICNYQIDLLHLKMDY